MVQSLGAKGLRQESLYNHKIYAFYDHNYVARYAYSVTKFVVLNFSVCVK